MARVNKTLLRTGVYAPPQGTLRATRSRMRAWVDKFQAMKAAGIDVPVCWGHQPDATPADADERARRQYWLGAYNAGYLRDLTLDADGQLDGKLDCPGVELKDGKLVHWVKLPDGRQVRGAIGEVSLAIKDHVDGQERRWEDVIVHVGLTPLPVAHGHGGFSLGGCTGDASGYTLSLANMTRTLSASEDDVADDVDDKPKKDDKAKPFEKKGKGEGGEDAEGGSTHFKDAMEYLKNRGVAMPEDTTEENFLERICVACHALENAETTGLEDEDLDEGAGAGGEPEAEYSGPEAAATEEQPPVMMSLATAKTPAERKLIALEQARHRRRLLRRLDGLVSRGLKARDADPLRAQIEGYTLSLSEDGEAAPQQVDVLLSALEGMAPPRHPLRGGQVAGARVAARPDLRDGDRTRQQEEVGDELASMAGAKAAKQ